MNTLQTYSIVPAIIPMTFEDLREHVQVVRGATPRVQVDVLDGTYAPGTSWPYGGSDRAFFESLRKEDEGLPFWQEVDYEIDLLLNEPERRMEDWVLAGAACLIIHVETSTKLDEIFAYAYDRRVEIALALKPSTDIERVAPFVDKVVFIQCMGNDKIGSQGVKLDPVALDTIAALRARWPHVTVGVDIGVNDLTVPQLLDAGATRFAAGSAVYESGDPKIALERLSEIVAEHNLRT